MKTILRGKIVARAILAVAFQVAVLAPQVGFADITVEQYCNLSVDCLQQEVANFQELIALVNQYGDDRETLNQLEEIKKAEFSREKEELFSSYGITDEQYGTYMGANGHEVGKYLEHNPSVKQQIDDLSAQASYLMDQYEILKGSEDEEPEEPPVE